MAKRKYSLEDGTLIEHEDGNMYELHGCQVTIDKTQHKVGFAPVRQFADVSDFREFVVDASDGNLELIVSDWKYGNGVRLQRMIRDMTSPSTDRKTPTDADKNRIGSSFTADELVHYAGKFDAMNAEIQRRWELERAEKPDADLSEYAETVWTDLII